MTVQHGVKGCMTVLGVLIAACCALAVGCSDSIDPGAPVVVRSDDWKPITLTEAAVLADRILRKEDDSLLLDATERDALAGETATVLSRIRDVHPAVADVTVRASYAFGELLLGLEPPLLEDVAALFEGQTGPVLLRTGQAEFDTLNERLGLTAVDLFPSTGTVIFYFNEYLNVPAAAAAYEAVEGVEYAEPNAHLGDGSDIDVLESGGRWYVVARRAWGDCPSGCINEEFFFFIVNTADVERIDPAQAMGIAEFRELVMNRDW